MLASIELEAATVLFPQLSLAASWDARLTNELSMHGNALGSKVAPLFQQRVAIAIPALAASLAVAALVRLLPPSIRDWKGVITMSDAGSREICTAFASEKDFARALESPEA